MQLLQPSLWLKVYWIEVWKTIKNQTAGKYSNRNTMKNSIYQKILSDVFPKRI